MAGGGWSCPHELEGRCSRAKNLPCDPGMKGCELYGRYVFFDASKNERQEQKKSTKTSIDQAMKTRETIDPIMYRSNP